jgi:hypothetical protein
VLEQHEIQAHSNEHDASDNKNSSPVIEMSNIDKVASPQIATNS